MRFFTGIVVGSMAIGARYFLSPKKGPKVYSKKIGKKWATCPNKINDDIEL